MSSSPRSGPDRGETGDSFAGRGPRSIKAPLVTKAIIVTPDGDVLASASADVRPHYGSDGLVEQDPHELLASVINAGRRALDESGVHVDVIGLANQGETVLAWNRANGEPLGSALVWQDRRAQSVCARSGRKNADELEARLRPAARPRTSQPPRWRDSAVRTGRVTASSPRATPG